MNVLLAVPAADSSGPFDLFMGMPVHPVVVHAVVVLIPLTALGVILMAAWPRFSRLHGWLVAGLSVAAVGAAFVAKLAGEALAERLGEPGFDHESFGSLMPWFAVGLAVVTIALYLVDRSSPAEGPNPRRTLRLVLAGVSVVVAVANMYWVFKTGDSGGRSVWTGRVQ